MSIQKKSVKIIVVLGVGVDENKKITKHSKLRYDVAIKFQNQYDFIICSLYKTYKEKAKNQIKTEAEAGKEYLVEKCVFSEKIILEEKSKDTFSNAYYTRELIENLNLNIEKITIVTSKFHMQKTKYLFDIVFPKENFNIDFIESENVNIDEIALKNRLISEKELILFYTEHLEKTYGIIKGNIESIKKFMENSNPALTGKKDKYHQELTRKIESKIQGNNTLH